MTFALFRLAFALARAFSPWPAITYKSPAHSSTGTRSGSKPSHCLKAYGFMFYFTPRLGFFFTFPSRYLFTIGHPGVFSLTRWSSLIHTGFHVPHATRDKSINQWYLEKTWRPTENQATPLQVLGENHVFSYHLVFDYWTFTIFGAGFSCFV